MGRVLRDYGPAWFFWRVLYDALRHSGRLQAAFPPSGDPRASLATALKLPAAEVVDHLAAGWRRHGGSLFLPEDICEYRRAIAAPDKLLEEAAEIVKGRLLFFRRQEREIGDPPDWLMAAVPSMRWPDQVHWTRIPDLSAELGDIKYVWEPSRFGHVYTLARAYALTGDERYPELFWSHVESWSRANQPELGPHWRCGQEMSLRSLAWIFGLYAFRGSPASRPERVALLIEQLWYHALHVEKIHWYASRCVRNNHALSEAVGLFTIGALFPFLPRAGEWQSQGLRRLAEEAAWQIYEDGSYVQHSMNYARLAVQLLTWTLCVASANRIEVPSVLRDRANRLLDFLVAMQDPVSGRVPNYGPNDGALIFPLSSCDYLDYRPALNALSLALDRSRLYESGPWDEEACWFLGLEKAAPGSRLPAPGWGKGALVPPGAGSLELGAASAASFPDGGYYLLRGEGTHALIRCTSYRHRPAQADMLHLDVWYQGHNVLVDPGTLSYNLDPHWSRYFVGTASHNTVTVYGRDQMKKGSRFMWLGWTKSRVLRFETQEGFALFEGEHYGYAPVVHRRQVVLHAGIYIVIDELAGDTSPHTFRLHWLVNDFPVEPDRAGATIRLPDRGRSPLCLMVLSSSAKRSSWARADEVTPRGWQSLYYGERLPAWSYEVMATGERVRFATLLGPADRVEALSPRTLADVDRLVAAWTTSGSSVGAGPRACPVADGVG
jgi:hypothetical protein